MNGFPLSPDEIGARARAIYERRFRARLEAGNEGKCLVIDVESEDYELDADELRAMKRAYEKHPGGRLYALRIGSSTLGHIGLSADTFGWNGVDHRRKATGLR